MNPRGTMVGAMAGLMLAACGAGPVPGRHDLRQVRMTLEPFIIAEGDRDGMELIDVDGDGLEDIVSCVSQGRIRVEWHRRGPQPGQWTTYTIFEGGTEMEGVTAGDFNGDGRIEVISLDQREGVLHLHVHDGDPTGEWRTVTLRTERPNLQDARAWDISGNGHIDLVYTWQGNSDRTGGVRWLEFTEGTITDPNNWREHIMVDLPGSWWLNSSGRVDLTGDGRGDIVFTSRLNNRNTGATPGVYWLEAPADPRATWPLHTIDATRADWLQVDTGDFFGDGHALDVAAIARGSEFNRPYVFRRSADWSRQALPRAADQAAFNLRACKFSDGPRTDLIYIAARDAMHLYFWADGRWHTQNIFATPYGHPMDDRIELRD